jgi:3-oxoacyl-[acyl-carrier-protein] synthase-3
VRGSTIVGLGYVLPERVVATEELGAMLGVGADWILSRTGIRARHVAAAGETVVDLATGAANRAIADSGVRAASIDAVIVATSTGQRMPSTATQVAARLGLQCGAFDVNAACAGFCHAIAVADGLIRTGGADTVLVVGADIASASIDWQDRYTAPIFGDGAGAALLQISDREDIGPTLWGSDGEHGSLVRLDHGTISQEGPTVFRWAIGLAEHVRGICRKGGIEPREAAAFVPHQANVRIIDALASNLQLVDTVIARDVTEVGNTMAASVPVALARLAERGELPAGGPIVLFGFGSGLSYAGQVVRLAPRD